MYIKIPKKKKRRIHTTFCEGGEDLQWIHKRGWDLVWDVRNYLAAKTHNNTIWLGE